MGRARSVPLLSSATAASAALPLRPSLVDLGCRLLCESYLRPDELNRVEPLYPLQCGVRTDFIDFAADRNLFKHGKVMSETHIPSFPPDHIRGARPDYLLILPWNLREEIMDQMHYIRERGGQFAVPIPEVSVYS